MKPKLINLKNAKPIICECGSVLFQPAMLLKKVSKFLSHTGREEIATISILVCLKCGEVPEHHKPLLKEQQDEKPD